MKLQWRPLIIFLAVIGSVAIATSSLGVEFGKTNFWDHHGFIFLVLVSFFPRLTLLLSSFSTGGIFWWMSFIFAPRLLVAVLATIQYWTLNPILVVISWLIAFGGESSEKFIVVNRARNCPRQERETRWVDAEVISTKTSATPPIKDTLPHN